MTTRLYRSTDGGAPSLTGAAGAGIALLDAVLINGYNSKTVTITRSGSTATATCVGHGFPNDGVTRITISGAGQTEYNIETYITNVTANTFDYTVTGAPATPATGTINAIVTPAGWAKTYTGTNLASYKNATSQVGSLHQRQLRVDDTNATYMLVCGYESMTDVNTGLGLMPLLGVGAATGGQYWTKSAAANATARPWAIIASETFILLYVDTAGTVFTVPTNGAHLQAYGDYVPFNTVDLYNTILVGGTGTTTNTSGYMYAVATPAYGTNFTGHFIQRGLNGSGGSRGANKSSICGGTTPNVLGAGYGPNTNIQNYFNFGHVYVQENASDGFILRGKFPGIMDPVSIYTMWTPGDILIPQSGTAAGRKFIFFKTTNSGTNTLTCGIMVDFSDNWDTE